MSAVQFIRTWLQSAETVASISKNISTIHDIDTLLMYQTISDTDTGTSTIMYLDTWYIFQFFLYREYSPIDCLDFIPDVTTNYYPRAPWLKLPPGWEPASPSRVYMG